MRSPLPLPAALLAAVMLVPLGAADHLPDLATPLGDAACRFVPMVEPQARCVWWDEMAPTVAGASPCSELALEAECAEHAPRSYAVVADQYAQERYHGAIQVALAVEDAAQDTFQLLLEPKYRLWRPDAGTDRDASEYAQHATQIAPVSFEGSLFALVDDRDWFSFETTEIASVRLWITSGGVTPLIVLYDPDGNADGWAHSAGLQGPPGRWTVLVQNSVPSGIVDYSIQLSVVPT